MASASVAARVRVTAANAIERLDSMVMTDQMPRVSMPPSRCCLRSPCGWSSAAAVVWRNSAGRGLRWKGEPWRRRGWEAEAGRPHSAQGAAGGVAVRS